MDTRKLLEALTQNPAASSALGGLAGSLLGSVLTGGGKGGGKLVKYGGLAAIGYVAYQAWQKHQAQQRGSALPTTPPASTQAVLPASIPAAFDLGSQTDAALAIVRAMVTAAKADGSVDGTERERIATRTRTQGLAGADQQEVVQLLTEPMDIEAVARSARTPELKAEIYAASVLAVQPASRMERAYLDMLAARLELEPGLVTELERAVDRV